MFTKQDVAIRHLFHFRETGGGDLSDEAFSPYALATFFLFYILMVRRVIIILILSLIKLDRAAQPADRSVCFPSRSIEVPGEPNVLAPGQVGR